MAAKKPKKTDDKDNNKAQLDALNTALDARDTAGIVNLLDQGLDANWQDSRGRSLLHYAAAWNDTKLVDALTDKGAKLTQADHAAASPQDIAIAFGHDALAQSLATRLKLAQANTAAPAGPKSDFPFADLTALRAESARSLTDQFNYHVRLGHLPQILVAAEKDAQGLSAADFLGRGPDGDTTLLNLCQKGQLGLLLDAKLWHKKPEEFKTLWSQVPKDYQKDHDADAFIAKLRQARLQSFGKPQLKGYKPKPK